ncbi:hypothetical protein EV182_008397, partial [Spiromyces aspiralis]
SVGNKIKVVLNLRNLPQESANHTPDGKLPAGWPSEGSIEFRDFSASYDKHVGWLLEGQRSKAKPEPSNKELPGKNEASPARKYILNHISFSTRGGERIGIVGRTGAGKSTLALSLFRFLEAKTGSIIIDGVDISTIGLEDLRSRMSIITQDPGIFNASVRFNIDPFDRLEDESIIKLLKELELYKEDPDCDDESEDTDRPFRSLNDMTFGRQTYLSAGQTQILSLARAIA